MSSRSRCASAGTGPPAALTFTSRSTSQLATFSTRPFPAAIAELLARFATPAKALTVEVTETAVMVDPPRAAETLGSIADLGVKIAIDDFGTGYTSLSWLKRLPVTTLKVDRSFVMDMHTNDDDAAIVRSTVNLARDLGLEVGWPRARRLTEAWNDLKELHCDLAQGYRLG